MEQPVAIKEPESDIRRLCPEVVVNDNAVWLVVSGEVLCADCRLARHDPLDPRFDLEEVGRTLSHLSGEFLKRGDICDENTAPMSADNEVVLPRMHDQVMDRDRRQVVAHSRPARPTIETGEDPEIGPDKQQVRILTVFLDHVDRTCGQRSAEGFPRFTEIRRHKNKRPEIVAMKAGQTHIGHGWVVM